MFKDVLDAVKLVGAAIGGARTARQQDREKLATLCDTIAEVLHDYIVAPTDLRQSMGICARLNTNLPALETLAQGKFLPAQIEGLRQSIANLCTSMQKVSAETTGGHELNERDLDDVVKAQGAFLGLADQLRAM